MPEYICYLENKEWYCKKIVVYNVEKLHDITIFYFSQN